MRNKRKTVVLVFALASVTVAGLTRRKAETAIRVARQAEWLDSLKQHPSTDITSEEIVEAIHEGRSERDTRRSPEGG
jgi:hypothetical protein